MVRTRTFSFSLFLVLATLRGGFPSAQNLPEGFNPLTADVYPQFFVGLVGDTEFRGEWLGSNLTDQTIEVTFQLATPEFTPIPEEDLVIIANEQPGSPHQPPGSSALSGSIRPAFLERKYTIPPLQTIQLIFIVAALQSGSPASETAGTALQVPGFMVVSSSAGPDSLVHSFRYNQWQNGQIISTAPVPSTQSSVFAATSVDRGAGKNAGFAIVNTLIPQTFVCRVYYPSVGPLEGTINVFGQSAFLLENLNIPDLPEDGFALVEIEVASQQAGSPAAPFWVTSLDFYSPPLSDRVLIFGKDVKTVPSEGLSSVLSAPTDH